MLPPVERFDSDTGIRIYRIPVEAFDNFIAYSYVLLNGDVPTLVDCGSGFDKSNADLMAGFRSLRDTFDEAIQLADIQRILITHGHIDHHGGLSFVQSQAKAEVGIHPLDRRILVAFEERVVIATKNLRVYLERCGVPAERIVKLMEMYGFGKQLIKSEEVHFLLEEHTAIDGMRFVHTPGHCPGQVCIQIGDVMLTADHILSRITPHQAPESITHYTGLGHYLDALDKVAKVDGIRLALGGHEDPIHDIYTRIADIKVDHQNKLERVLKIISDSEKPLTLDSISRTMYPDMKSYHVLLALEETGAHVEYLYERGVLAISNLDEVEAEDNPALAYCVA